MFTSIKSKAESTRLPECLLTKASKGISRIVIEKAIQFLHCISQVFFSELTNAFKTALKSNQEFFPGTLAQWHARSSVCFGNPDSIHVPNELRQVSYGRPDLQISGKHSASSGIGL